MECAIFWIFSKPASRSKRRMTVITTKERPSGEKVKPARLRSMGIHMFNWSTTDDVLEEVSASVRRIVPPGRKMRRHSFKNDGHRVLGLKPATKLALSRSKELSGNTRCL